MEAAGAARPLADKFLRNILARGPSVHQVMRYDTTFKSERNRRECLALAKLLDALLARDVHAAKEVACRRLAGVHLADMSGDWNVCDVFEGVMDKQSYVPEEFLQRVVKSVMRIEALDKSAASSGRDTTQRKRTRNREAASGGATSSSRGSGARPPSRGPGDRSSSGAPASAGRKSSITGGSARGGSDKQ
jgi:hypothetical protein